MRIAVAAIALLVSLGSIRAAEEPRLLERVTPLPTALDRDFRFRKTKLFYLGEKAASGTKQKQQLSKAGEDTSANAGAKSKSTSVVQEASITFERQYRLFGAVTKLDQHQRFGDYLDFFWQARRPADVTVRLEYRQEQVQAHGPAHDTS